MTIIFHQNHGIYLYTFVYKKLKENGFFSEKITGTLDLYKFFIKFHTSFVSDLLVLLEQDQVYSILCNG